MYSKQLAFRLFLFLFVAGFSVAVLSCGNTKTTTDIQSIHAFHVDIQWIYNAMPMTTSKPYLIIDLTSDNEAFTENFKLTQLTASGDEGTWETKVFDRNEFSGKGFKTVSNCARNFDVNLGAHNQFKLVVTFESGVQKEITIRDVSMQTVY